MTLRRHRTAPAATMASAVLIALSALAVGSPATADTVCDAEKISYITDKDALQNLDLMDVQESWRLATGKNVTVAVVDSGVTRANTHLRTVVKDGRSFVGGNPHVDAQGHGTVVAGIIAAEKIKQSVLVGAAPDATILPVQVFREMRDQGNSTEVADGIRWAAQQNASVINVSLSTGPNDPNLGQLKSAVEFAVTRDAVIVASAGNRGRETALTQVQYPAGFPGVIGVAGANRYGDVDDWSIHGAHVDVAAPGSHVLSTFYAAGDCVVGTDHPYTSYATAYVSALAAQMREKFPNDSAAEITNRILSTADRPQSTERDDHQGWGLIQPLAALQSTSAAAPGEGAAETTDTKVTGPATDSLNRASDPATINRNRLLWWSLAAVAVLAVALIVRPLSVSRARGAETADAGDT